jgi:hypothetical protein
MGCGKIVVLHRRGVQGAVQEEEIEGWSVKVLKEKDSSESQQKLNPLGRK